MPAKKIFRYSLTLAVSIFIPFIAAAALVKMAEVNDITLRDTVLRETYSADFLERKDCDYGGLGRLSVSPLSYFEAKIRPATQAEERVKVHTRVFECMPYALNEVEAFISTMPASAKKTRAIGLFKDALGWWKGGSLFYTNTVIQTLSASQDPRYRVGYPLDDSNYAWTYTHNAMIRLAEIVRTYGVFDAQHFSKDVLVFLDSATKNTVNQLRPKGDMFLATGQTYFASPISAEQTAVLVDLDRLHREAGEALLCKLQTGDWCPGGRPASVAAAEYDAKTVTAQRSYGLPGIPPFSRGVYADLNYAQLCVISQRIEHAHHAWVDGIMRGDTVEGFRHSWLSGLGHALLHVERRRGVPLHEREGILERFKVSPEVRVFTDYAVPGVGADGTCHLDFEDSHS